ncbi:MAG: hypothetical protein ABI669_03835 [Usitatibacter sp.]
MIQIARDYLASLSPAEWSSVPRACRPERIKEIDDLSFWHRRLADEYLGIASTTQGNEMLRDMLAFFAAAAQRSTQIGEAALSPNTDAADAAPSNLAESRQPGG